jgi:hypothetical protein
VVGDVGVAGPDGSDHDCHTLTSDPSLNTIPNTLTRDISYQFDIGLSRSDNIQP